MTRELLFWVFGIALAIGLLYLTGKQLNLGAGLTHHQTCYRGDCY